VPLISVLTMVFFLSLSQDQREVASFEMAYGGRIVRDLVEEDDDAESLQIIGSVFGPIPAVVGDKRSRGGSGVISSDRRLPQPPAPVNTLGDKGGTSQRLPKEQLPKNLPRRDQYVKESLVRASGILGEDLPRDLNPNAGVDPATGLRLRFATLAELKSPEWKLDPVRVGGRALLSADSTRNPTVAMAVGKATMLPADRAMFDTKHPDAHLTHACAYTAMV
jgi:hypothetical protein